MIKKIKKPFVWILITALLWLVYLLISILNFPVGTLSDKADAAIVLGAAVHNEKPSPVFAERLNHSINLYHAGQINKIIFTGGVGEEQKYAEASIARNYAISKQVKVSDILVETESLTTRQNLVNAKKLIDPKDITKVLLISDSLHLKRATLMAKDLGFNVQTSATPTSRYQSLKTKLPFALRELYFYHHYLIFRE